MRGESPCAGCLDEASVTKPTASWPTSASYAASLRKVGRLPAANPRRGMRTSQRWRAAMVRASEGVIPPQPCEGHRNPLALDGAANPAPGKPTTFSTARAPYAASLRKVGRLPAANPRRGMWTSQRWRAAMVRASEGVIPPQPCEGHRNPLAQAGCAIQRRASRRRSRRRGPLTRRACARLGDCPRPTLAGECGHHNAGVQRWCGPLRASSRRSPARECYTS